MGEGSNYVDTGVGGGDWYIVSGCVNSNQTKWTWQKWKNKQQNKGRLMVGGSGNEKDLLMGETCEVDTNSRSLIWIKCLPLRGLLFVYSKKKPTTTTFFFSSHHHQRLSFGGIIKCQKICKGLFLHEKYVWDPFRGRVIEINSSNLVPDLRWNADYDAWLDSFPPSLKSIVLNRLRPRTIQLYSQYRWAGFLLRNIWRYENLAWPIYFDLGKTIASRR